MTITKTPAKAFVTAALAMCTLLTACGHSQMVYREPTGGQLALKGTQRAAMRRAQADMAAHCGDAGYHITREEVIVLGTRKSTVAQFGAGKNGAGGQFVHSEAPEKEHRITYRCGSPEALTAAPSGDPSLDSSR